VSSTAVVNFELRGRRADRLGQFASMSDAGRALPDGAYTTLRTFYGDRVVALESHAERLSSSAARLGVSGEIRPGELAAALAAALSECGHPESRVRITFAPPRSFASVERFTPVPEALRRDGVACVTLPLSRSDAACKDTRFAVAAHEAAATLPVGVHEGLLTAPDGSILEGLSSNFFALWRGALRTEDRRALPGLTRSLLLSLAREQLPVEERAIRAAHLPEVAESFITSSSRGVLPVVRIDGATIGCGRPGPVTRGLAERLDTALRHLAEPLSALAGAG
jgi:branched-chain amino acid aminotransferase